MRHANKNNKNSNNNNNNYYNKIINNDNNKLMAKIKKCCKLKMPFQKGESSTFS